MLDSLFHTLQRLFTLLGFIAFVGILYLFADFLGVIGDAHISARADFTATQVQSEEEPSRPFTQSKASDNSKNSIQIAIISGHAGNDSGAICEDDDGELLLTEAETVAQIAELTVSELQRLGYDVLLLNEFDERLDDLQVDALVSLHADSCLATSGFKAAIYEKSVIPEIDGLLLECMNMQYAAVTGLAADLNTITPDMTEYHAFRKIHDRTPALILELGYLGGDRHLLTRKPEIPARAIAEGVGCFVRKVH